MKIKFAGQVMFSQFTVATDILGSKNFVELMDEFPELSPGDAILMRDVLVSPDVSVAYDSNLAGRPVKVAFGITSRNQDATIDVEGVRRLLWLQSLIQSTGNADGSTTATSYLLSAPVPREKGLGFLSNEPFFAGYFMASIYNLKPSTSYIINVRVEYDVVSLTTAEQAAIGGY